MVGDWHIICKVAVSSGWHLPQMTEGECWVYLWKLSTHLSAVHFTKWVVAESTDATESRKHAQTGVTLWLPLFMGDDLYGSVFLLSSCNYQKDGIPYMGVNIQKIIRWDPYMGWTPRPSGLYETHSSHSRLRDLIITLQVSWTLPWSWGVLIS